jgi:hypothetical protein
MSTQLAEFELAQPIAPEIAALHEPEADVFDADMLDSGDPSSVVRGIINALFIATPFWVLFAFVLYLLI